VSSLKKTEPLPVDSHLHGSPANGACQRAAASDVGKRKEREQRVGELENRASGRRCVCGE
jgi:hypothetical protein